MNIKYIIMKKTILIIGIIPIFFLSCQEDFLDRNPPDRLSSETFWKTEQDAQMALAGVYQSIRLDFANRGALFQYTRAFTDVFSGDLFSPQTAYQLIGAGLVESTSLGLVDGLYRLCYTVISDCNIFLANIDRVEMDGATRNRMIGEVRFLRAFAYFHLTEYYGGVVMYTSPPTIEESRIAKSTKQEVVTQILSDLDAAIGFLPDVPYTDGHAVKGSALAYKAKVLMHNEMWGEAAAAADLVIQSGKFSLSDDFQGLFISPGQANNPEIVFSTRNRHPNNFIGSGTAPVGTGGETPGPTWQFGSANQIQPLPHFIDAFESIDGLPINLSPLYDPAAPAENRDPRLAWSAVPREENMVRSDGFEWRQPDILTAIPPGHFRINKHINFEHIPIPRILLEDDDFVLIRYAEVLLIYAESTNESSGPDGRVYDAVNEVRTRAGMPDLPAGLTQGQMRDRIRNERRVEFAFEGLSWMDVKRWRTAEFIIPTITDKDGVTRQFDPAKNYLMPFPQAEIDANENLVQNPGY